MFTNKRRKSAKIQSDELVVKDNVTQISEVDLDKLEINFNGQIARFRRLRYKNCPQMVISRTKGTFIDKEELIFMDRDQFVKEMYKAFGSYSTKSQTGYGRFCFLCSYVSFWDEQLKLTTFSENEVLEYFKLRESEVTKGEINKNTLVKERQHLKSILKELGKSNIAAQIPKIFGRRKAAKPTKAIPDKEYTDLGHKLLSSYKKYVEHILAGKPPLICPIFDERLALKNGYDEKKIKRTRHLRYVETGVCWTNTATQLALLIFAMWSGANLTPLATLTRKDALTIKKSSGDLYEFNSEKARALYEKQKLGTGFTKRSKEFIESWLLISEKIALGDDAPLFPFINVNGELNLSHTAFANPHKRINKKLVAMGLTEVTFRKLRSTRSSVVQRAFEDIFITAAANRNTPTTTQEHYLEGVDEVHEITLAGAFEVQKALADGEDKKVAIKKFRETIKDPFTTDEWKKKKASATATKIPTGVRCTAPKGEIAIKSLRALKSLNLGDDRECISFLACFDCPKHALVAEVDDIWLMLSFRDSILLALSRPAVNSIPKASFDETLEKTNLVLHMMENTAPHNYKIANNKNKEAPHPLYKEDDDLSDLLEIYAL